MKKPIVWIVNPYDPVPSDSQQPIRYAYLAAALAQKDVKVVWWTSSFDHISKKQRAIAQPNHRVDCSYQIATIPVPNYRSNTGFARLWNHLIFEFRFYRKASKTAERPDVILASLPPLLTPWLAMRLASKWRSIGIIDVQDLWPEAFLTLLARFPKRLVQALLNGLYRLRDSAVQNATSVTGVSATYASAVARNEPDKHQAIFVLGADVASHRIQSISSSRVPEKTSTEQWFLRSGVVGHFCDVGVLIATAKQLSSSRPDIKLVIAGRGPAFPALKQGVAKHDLQNLLCYEDVSYEELIVLHRFADATLCLYTEDATHSLVNKAFDSMAAGKAIINSVAGEMADVVESERIGINCQAGDSDSLMEAIVTLASNTELLSLYGENARRLADERYDKRVVYEQYAEWILGEVGK